MAGFFSWLGNLLWSAFQYLWQNFAMLWNSFWAQLVVWVSDGATWLKSLLPAGLQAYFESDLLNTNVVAFVDALTFFVPVVGLFSIVTGAYALAATVRLVRWVKSFVPTISG